MELKNYCDGTHRVYSPTKTLNNITPFLSSMGITRVANLTGLDDIDIPVIGVSRPNSKSLSTSQGKGHSLEAAKVSGIMESVEGYHAENIDLETVTDSYNNIIKLKKAHYISLAMSSAKEFNEDTQIEWARCYRIDDRSEVWIPYELIHADFTVPFKNNQGYFIADSNGLASGNTITEAINHGLYEVIERDCLALWQLTPSIMHAEKKIDLKTINDDYLKSILKKLKAKAIHIGIWDLTSEIGIPTFLCKMISDTNIGIRPTYGSGTHLNKNVALSRAITEAAQSRVTFISGARDDQYDEIYESEISDQVYTAWLNELKDLDSSNLKSFTHIADFNFPSLDEDQDYILSKLRKVGLNDFFYADLTKEEFGIPVVKVIIPGLEGVTHPERRLLGERGLKLFEMYGVGACEVK